jgi:hypothetical protein
MGQKQKIVQKMKFVDDSILEKALRYYRFFFAIYGKKIPPKELELFAFTAVRGTITPKPARLEFINRFGSSSASIENIKSRLVKKNLFVVKDGKYKINPKFSIDFSKDLVLRIDFNLKDEQNEL